MKADIVSFQSSKGNSLALETRPVGGGGSLGVIRMSTLWKRYFEILLIIIQILKSLIILSHNSLGALESLYKNKMLSLLKGGTRSFYLQIPST